ncbi:MAG TPA: patatin family protein, partial [Firmicutes bacterium]|nr:patatin family protein [Bacillota bacterium]
EDSPQTYNSDVDLLDALEREGRIFLIRPEFPTGVSSTDKNKKKLAALYEEGRRIALARLGDMRKYLGGEQ